MLEAASDSGELFELFAAYLETCASTGGARATKRDGRIPNVAGFCRFMGVTLAQFERFSHSRPEYHGAICAALEDEALNSEMPASVLSVYLKLRLGYGGESDSSVTDQGQLRIIFDHDAYADGE